MASLLASLPSGLLPTTTFGGSRMRVFLVHGMGRSRASMALLAARLHRGGHAPSLFGYLVAVQSLGEISQRFADHVRKGAHGKPYAVVGHSLGNIITRHAWPQLPEGFSRFVMLAPPNQPARLARKLRRNPVFQVLTGSAGQALADESFYATLPRPPVPTLILAGNGGPRFRWLPLSDAPSDGVVTVDETRLEGTPHRVVPAVHTFIMNKATVARTIMRFIERPVPPPASGPQAIS